MSIRIGYKASAEQFGPRDLLRYSRSAEEHGLELIAVSDHFQPWRHHTGHAPAALPLLGALGQATSGAAIGTSVLTPTLRYHPSVVAQAFATLALLNPNRVFLGIGSGEAMNETPATGEEFPGRKERRLRLAESVALMRRLWQEERVDFAGQYYRVSRATIYDRPDTVIPIYIAASGPLAARLAGRSGDGFICTSGKDPQLYLDLLASVNEGARDAGRDPSAIRRMIEIKVSYDRDIDYARQACNWWAPLALSPEQKEGIDDPLELERVADRNPEKAQTRFIVSDDPNEVVERIAGYLALGFDDLVLHGPGPDQERFLDLFSRDILAPLCQRSEEIVIAELRDLLVWLAGTASPSGRETTNGQGATFVADMNELERGGIVERSGGAVVLTDRGWNVCDQLSNSVESGSGIETFAPSGLEVARSAAASDDPFRLRYLANFLLWIAGDSPNKPGAVGNGSGLLDSRLIRQLGVAEASRVVDRRRGRLELTPAGHERLRGEGT